MTPVPGLRRLASGLHDDLDPDAPGRRPRRRSGRLIDGCARRARQEDRTGTT